MILKEKKGIVAKWEKFVGKCIIRVVWDKKGRPHQSEVVLFYPKT
jgi:hypothetical protein